MNEPTCPVCNRLIYTNQAMAKPLGVGECHQRCARSLRRCNNCMGFYDPTDLRKSADHGVGLCGSPQNKQEVSLVFGAALTASLDRDLRVLTLGGKKVVEVAESKKGKR